MTNEPKKQWQVLKGGKVIATITNIDELKGFIEISQVYTLEVAS